MNNNKNLLDRINEQLDTLIPFLAISHQEVFELMQRERYIWFLPIQQDTLPSTYDIFEQLVTRSAFLLGYSYLEVFLADTVKQIYRSNPRMLPKDKQVKYGEIVEATSYDEIIDHLIEREVLDLFYQGADKIVKYFKERLRLEWTEEQEQRFMLASLVRNCIVHNMSQADARLSQVSAYKIGEDIKLSAPDAHELGIVARNLARSLYTQASERYFDKP
jgi:hypothetical protein